LFYIHEKTIDTIAIGHSELKVFSTFPWFPGTPCPRLAFSLTTAMQDLFPLLIKGKQELG
jgi:hypothetical protein